jgi:hypothetical protein
MVLSGQFVTHDLGKFLGRNPSSLKPRQLPASHRNKITRAAQPFGTSTGVPTCDFCIFGRRDPTHKSDGKIGLGETSDDLTGGFLCARYEVYSGFPSTLR